jgi:hypothetical protein
VALKRTVWFSRRKSLVFDTKKNNLLGLVYLVTALVPSDTGVLSQLTGQKQTDSCLDFPASDGRTLVVVGKTRGLSSDAFENVIDEIVHDRHGFKVDASVGVDLLQRFIVGILIAVFFSKQWL